MKNIKDSRKVVIIGCGFVGMSYAYALLNQSACDEMVLVDIDEKRAEGEAMDLNHGLAFAPSSMKIRSGRYSDCHDANIVAIAAGVGQKPGETRISLLNRNAAIFRGIVSEVVKSGFEGVFLVATNPVDIMTRIVIRESGFDPRRVIGTGTTLDTARLRYLLGDYFGIDSRNIHAYVIGEHGDSEFVPWSQAMIGTKSVTSICRSHSDKFCMNELYKIGEEVKNAAYKIIEAKRATYYGIGMAMTRITKAILGDENSILTVSSQLDGEYGINSGVCVGTPSIVGRNGVLEHVALQLSPEETKKLHSSCDYLDKTYTEMNIAE